jgi:hypothetical protein
MRTIALNERGFALAEAGRRDEALALHREVLRLSTSGADVRFVATALEGVAGGLAGTDASRSAMLLGAAEAVRGAPVPGRGADRAFVDRAGARARAALGDRRYREGVAAGRGLSAHDAIDLALRDEGPAPA